MNLSDWISIISIIVAIIALLYSAFTNTKKFELTYQYFNDVLNWHNEVIEILILLRIGDYNGKEKHNYLAKLSTLLDSGRFLFPNIDKRDNFGKEKPAAYQGYRDVILDLLFFSYELFGREDYKNYLKHAEYFQRLFTSCVFEYLDPKKRRKQIKRNTSITNINNFCLEDFLDKSPDSIYCFYGIY